ncbi:hypothetical protein PVAG01_01366 [Phlyctema vagabunda]|uniref:DUF7730 domain-containing protein n=1 Tax=Phlyctema vagabunda TaxID=108571 RepID=A0ABR4PWX6_9HELO
MAHPASTVSRDGPQGPENIFRFLDLPTEIRLKIYDYLLPARTHTIATQYPQNGYFYNTATIPLHSAQSFYPFGRTAPRHRLTTYKVLNTNFRIDTPAPEICPQIFQVCRQIRDEAEPVLYGGNTIFDFGVHTDAIETFFQDRSAVARSSVRMIRIAKEIPEARTPESDEPREVLEPAVDESWASLCKYLMNSLQNLRVVDLTLWSSTGSTASMPPSSTASLESHEEEKQQREKEWREWNWTHDLLDLEVLNALNITYWGFNRSAGPPAGASFDSWLAKRMVNDRLVKERMIRDGVAVEGIMVLRGQGSSI